MDDRAQMDPPPIRVILTLMALVGGAHALGTLGVI